MSDDDLILSADSWPSNGHLIADVARLHLDRSMKILDPTYGKGNWWTLWKPTRLVKRSNLTDPEFDFRAMTYADGTFDAVAYDPPYVSTGGRSTTTTDEFNDSYGIGANDETKSPRELQERVINPGLTECVRVTKVGGLVLVKVKDYVSSGKLWRGVDETKKHADSLKTPMVRGARSRLPDYKKSVLPVLELVDQFIMVGRPGPQSQTTQVHARNNCSWLLVYRKKN